MQHGDGNFTVENLRQAPTTGNKGFSVLVSTKKNVFLNPNLSRILISFKWTLLSCANTCDEFLCRQNQLHKYEQFTHREYGFLCMPQSPVCVTDRQVNAVWAQILEKNYKEGTQIFHDEQYLLPGEASTTDMEPVESNVSNLFQKQLHVMFSCLKFRDVVMIFSRFKKKNLKLDF